MNPSSKPIEGVSASTEAQPPIGSLPRLGIDISKDTFDACLLLLDLSAKHHRFDNNKNGFAELQAWLISHSAPCTLAGLEATGCYALALLKFLHQQRHQACLLNPRHVKDFARSQGLRVKTDKVDARLIATFLRHPEHLQIWQPPSEELTLLQALVRRRQQLLQDLRSERNRLEDPLITLFVKRDIQGHEREIKARLKAADLAIEEHVLNNAALQKQAGLLRSIPGIGIQVAVTLLAELPLMTSFGRARSVAAFAGLTPSLAQSGTSIHRRGCITRQGPALLRKMLYMAALQTAQKKHPLHTCYEAMLQRGKPRMCALVAMMHKLLRIAYGVLKHETAFAVNLARLNSAPST